MLDPGRWTGHSLILCKVNELRWLTDHRPHESLPLTQGAEVLVVPSGYAEDSSKIDVCCRRLAAMQPYQSYGQYSAAKPLCAVPKHVIVTDNDKLQGPAPSAED